MHGESRRFLDAEAGLNEALTIYRENAKENPVAFHFNLAKTLENRGILYTMIRRFEEAEADFSEALDIHRQLSA